MRSTPVVSSPARIARSTGAAPRHRGSREKWRLTIGTASSGGRGEVGVRQVSGGEPLLPDDAHGGLAGVVVEALDEQHAVEVVHLVLEGARQELVSLDGHLVAVEVVPLEVDLLRAEQL